MENLIEIRKKLQRLSDQLDEKDSLSSYAFMTEEEFIENNLSMQKPTKRLVSNEIAIKMEHSKNTDEVNKIKLSANIKFFAGIAFLVCAAFLILGGVFEIGFLLTNTMIAIFPLIFGCSLYQQGKKAKKAIKDYADEFETNCAQARREDAANEEYNKNEYPKLIAAYNEEVEALKPLYVTTRDNAQKKLDILNAQMEREEPILAQKYYGDIKEIIEIIDDGRAVSLADAINILIADQNSQRLIMEQIRQTQIQEEKVQLQRQQAEAERRELERHNKEMEAAAKEQIDLQKRQVELSKCRTCSHEPHCSKNYCRGYLPKRRN